MRGLYRTFDRDLVIWRLKLGRLIFKRFFQFFQNSNFDHVLDKSYLDDYQRSIISLYLKLYLKLSLDVLALGRARKIKLVSLVLVSTCADVKHFWCEILITYYFLGSEFVYQTRPVLLLLHMYGVSVVLTFYYIKKSHKKVKAGVKS